MTTRMLALLLVLLLRPFGTPAQEHPLPIIDMRLHARDAPDPQRRLCLPVAVYGVIDPVCPEPLFSPLTDEAMIEQTVAILERRNIIGVVSGYPLERVPRFQQAAPRRLIPLDIVKCAHEGTRKMRESMSSMALPDPEFEEKEIGNFLVRVTLRNNVDQRKAWVDRDVTELIGSLLARSLSENEKRFVNFVAEHGEISVSDAQRLSAVSWSTAKNILMKLVNRGILRRDSRGNMERDARARFRLDRIED